MRTQFSVNTVQVDYDSLLINQFFCFEEARYRGNPKLLRHIDLLLQRITDEEGFLEYFDSRHFKPADPQFLRAISSLENPADFWTIVNRIYGRQKTRGSRKYNLSQKGTAFETFFLCFHLSRKDLFPRDCF